MLAGAPGMKADGPPQTLSHTFTNANGTTIQAVILSVVGDEVNLQRDDGQKFRPKIALFSQADQAYIRLWVARSIGAKGIVAFNASTVKGISKGSLPTLQKTTASTWQENYSVRVKNQTTMTWPKLRFEYIIFKLVAQFDQLPPDDFTVQRFGGSFDVDDFTAGQEKVFSLDKINMTETKLVAGYYLGNGAPATVDDKLKGIWIRVYDGTNMIQEWASDPSIPKTERWTAPPDPHGGVVGGAPNPYGP